MSDQEGATQAGHDGPEGIGGWLILPVIGLVITPISGVIQLFGYFGLLKSLSFLNTAQKAFLLVEALGNIAITIVLPIVLLFLLFNKRSGFPNLYIIWAAANFLFVLFDLFMAKLLFGELFAAQGVEFLDGDTMKGIVQSIVLVAIWIPYMLNSRRVRNTFVQ